MDKVQRNKQTTVPPTPTAASSQAAFIRNAKSVSGLVQSSIKSGRLSTSIGQEASKLECCAELFSQKAVKSFADIHDETSDFVDGIEYVFTSTVLSTMEKVGNRGVSDTEVNALLREASKEVNQAKRASSPRRTPREAQSDLQDLERRLAALRGPQPSEAELRARLDKLKGPKADVNDLQARLDALKKRR